MISVIVPVYRAEKYIAACIDSLLAQSCELEIILIDDGSNDNSGVICDQYAERYSNIFVMHQNENQGQSVARNIGLQMAHGEFIGFVDADDTVEPDMYATLLHHIKNHDIAMCLGRGIADGDTPLPTNTDGRIECLDKKQLMKEIITNQNCSACNKLYRAELVKNARFPEAYRRCEELLFHLAYLPLAKSAVKIHVQKYNYFQRPNSTTKSLTFTEAAFSEVHSHDRAVKIVQRDFPEYLQGIMVHSFTARLNVVRKLYYHHREGEYQEVIAQYRAFWKEHYKQLKQALPLRRRLEYLFYIRARWMYAFMMLLIQYKHKIGRA